MNRKKSLGLMKIACMITFVLGIALFGFAAPMIVLNLPEGGIFGRSAIPDLMYVEAVGVLCFLSLWQAWRICGEIGRDNSFSRENARSLKRISLYMAIACRMMAVGLVICLVCHDGMVPTGLTALGTCIALIFALFARAMAQLIEAGAALKDENDLTI